MKQANTNAPRPVKSKTKAGLRADIGIVTRAAMATALMLMLFGAVRWAMSISNANTHRVASDLGRLQDKLADRDAAANAHPAADRETAPVAKYRPVSGPTLSPPENDPPRRP